jgi:hypothetical protein
MSIFSFKGWTAFVTASSDYIGSMASEDDEMFTTIPVECYAGSRGEETPRRFGARGSEIEIAEVLDRWLAPDHRYFKVRDHQGAVYILRHDGETQQWELRFFRRSRKVP